MFNKKLLMGLCNLVGVLIVLTILLNVVMYVWAFWAMPPLPNFDPKAGLVSYYRLLNQLVTLVFFYIMLGGFAGLIKNSKLPENFKK